MKNSNLEWKLPLDNFKTCDTQTRVGVISEANTVYTDGRLTLKCTIGPSGGSFVLHGENGRVGGADWEAACYVVLDVYHENRGVLSLELAFSPEEESECEGLVTLIGILPGLRTRIAFPLASLDSQQLFLGRTPGKLKTVVTGGGIRPSRVARFSIGTVPGLETRSFEISNLHLSTAQPDYPLPELSLVDPLGQYAGADWPGKTSNAAELVEYLKQEISRPHPSAFAADRNRFGGLASRQFGSTGYFRTHHDGHRWWLVDPDGCAFISAGVDCVNPGESTRVTGIESLFAWLPPSEGDFAAAWHQQDEESEWSGDYADFAKANLIRAFGSDWFNKWCVITKHRLLEWGFNTVGNWSSFDFIHHAQMPYVWPLHSFPETVEHVFRDFPDVFSEEYRDNSIRFAKQLEPMREDPYMIGYFLRNEPHWAFAGDVNLAEKLLESEAQLASKHALMVFMIELYDGDTKRWNEAWNSDFEGFEQLLLPIQGAASLSDRAREDLERFTEKMIERYVALPSEMCRTVDPNHLNLGMRYAWISTEKLYAGCHHFDVFSINQYKMRPDAEEIGRIATKSGRPVIIGEFHFGAPDAGLLATGLKGVATQQERGAAYRYYIENGAVIPELVGMHYFLMNDQPVLGRFDGENFQVGIIDVCHRPYQPFIEGIQEAHRNLYALAYGTREPYSAAPKEIPRIGF